MAVSVPLGFHGVGTWMGVEEKYSFVTRKWGLKTSVTCYCTVAKVVSYSIIKRTAHRSLQNNFSLQNKYIAEVGAISIQCIPEETMEFEYWGKTKQPFHQWLLESKYVLSVEHSDTPHRNKWWILTSKEHMTWLNKHLTTTVKEIMVKIHQTPEDYRVQPQVEDRIAAEPLNPQLTSLLAKQTPTEEISQPHSTGRAHYAEMARRHTANLRTPITQEQPLPAIPKSRKALSARCLPTTQCPMPT